MTKKFTIAEIQNQSAFEQKYRYTEKIGDYAEGKIRQRKYVVENLCTDFSDKKATTLALRILNCTGRHPCNNPFCPKCRHAQQELFAQSMIENFGNVDADKLRFLTILHEVHYNSADINLTLIKKLKKKLDNDLDKLQLFADENIRLLGAYEIHAIAADEKLSDRKVNTLSALGYDKDKKSPSFLLHFHAVICMPKFKNEKYDIEGELRKIYQNSYQVDFTKLRDDKSHTDNLHDIATYMLKFRLQHSVSVASDDNSKQFTRTQYSTLYSPIIAKSVVMAVESCNGFQGLKTRRYT
ncbi:hypothetical protein [Magnetospirillum sp. SS-4]|uniref:hypothetical protein n=1 Tax=Magnetospirillum sp. SS-4 TaxID=2681465 RepID=UPI001385FE90|nr:hypothetical protein [Magnetospirillum sp. SS-4]CAA7620353.1 conserved hypothetical protein [Magnetospirillum sp. SS-4]